MVYVCVCMEGGSDEGRRGKETRVAAVIDVCVLPMFSCTLTCIMHDMK